MRSDRAVIRSDMQFAVVPRWLVEAGLSDKAFRLYVVLAAHADYETDACTPGRKRLAKLCACSVDTIDRAKKELVDRGFLTIEQRSDTEAGNLTNVYVLHRVPPASRTDAEKGSRTDAAQTNTSRNEKDPSPLDPPSPPPREPQSVNRRVVTEEEHDRTDGILDAFNSRFGTDYRGPAVRRAIVSRIRERPELTLADHVALIEKMNRNPWWTDAASPQVIYGNSGVFERCLNQPDQGEPAGSQPEEYGF